MTAIDDELLEPRCGPSTSILPVRSGAAASRRHSAARSTSSSTWRREFGGVAALLQTAGLDQERRALRCTVRDLKVESEAGTVTLSFGLGRGQFATAVLREIMEFPVDTPLEGDSE